MRYPVAEFVPDPIDPQIRRLLNVIIDAHEAVFQLHANFLLNSFNTKITKDTNVSKNY
jgi:hypothetical protein